MSTIHAPKRPELDVRMLAFPTVTFALLSVLFMRLWYFQVLKAPELVEKADVSRSIEVTSPAPRGLIFDRNGVLVAGVKPEIVITAIPSEVKKNPWVIDKVASILKVDAHKLELKLKEAEKGMYLASPIYVGATVEAGAMISESRDDLPGIQVEMQPMRYYPDSKSYSHVLGYVWTASKKDQKRIEALGRKPNEYVGKSGLESAFETDLMGESGSETEEIDAKRRPVRVASRNMPTPGDQLILSIDSKLQKFATQYMAENHLVGGVVALDPKTGEVLCLVSSPTFDQSLFEQGISQADLDSIEDPKNNMPLFDRAIAASYPPGSTFKIVTSIAAFEKGIFSPNTQYFCAGGVRVGKAFFKCLGHHGELGYYDAMAKSCNSYFYQLGLAAGKDALRKACADVGLGEKEGLEMGGESKGTVPTEAFIKRYRKNDKWYTGDTLNFSIGQGFVTATPLQLANLIALVANNGTSYKPHLVREIRQADGKGQPTFIQPEVEHHVDATPEFWQELHTALIGVMDHGTASYFGKLPGVVWAGKTGSAENGVKSADLKTHALFVGFAPADDPKIAICVVVESKGHGGEWAAPPARDIVADYLKESESKTVPNNDASASASVAGAALPSER